MKFFIIFYLFFGLMTPSMLRDVRYFNPSTMFAKTSGVEIAGMIGLILLLLFYPTYNAMLLWRARKNGTPAPDNAIRAMVVTVLSFTAGVVLGLVYKF